MLDDKIYAAQIQRIELAFLYDINDLSVESWKPELEAEGISNEDLISGVDYMINNPGKFAVRPALPNLLEHCGKAKYLRWEKEEAKKKAEKMGNYYETHPATDHGKRALTIIKLFMKGSREKDGETVPITPKDKVDYMLKMEEFYPGVGWQREAMALRRHYGLT